MSRQFDLESLVRKSYEIFHEYEERRLLSDRPDEKERADFNIKKYSENVRNALIAYREYVDANPGIKIPTDIAELGKTFLVTLPESFSYGERTNEILQANSPKPTTEVDSSLATCGAISWLVLSLIIGWVIYDKFDASWWSAFLCWGPVISLILAAGFMGLAQQSRK